jgi:hypothetical protein
MTGLLRTHALIRAVDYIVARGLAGAFVECGVWRGGSVMAMLLRLIKLGATHHDVYLYDTFDGMTAPGVHDTSRFEGPALDTWQTAQGAGHRAWREFFKPEVFNFEAVRDAVLSCGYPESRIHFIKGPVEQTLPERAPAQIALLRLDTDWFESTQHELIHLYPRVTQGGVLIIDDYGHWEGCRRAVDQYFASGEVPAILLNRIDYTGRIGVKG